MPYRVLKRGKKYDIVRKSDGKVVGSSTSRGKAWASVRARNAAHGKKK